MNDIINLMWFREIAQKISYEHKYKKCKILWCFCNEIPIKTQWNCDKLWKKSIHSFADFPQNQKWNFKRKNWSKDEFHWSDDCSRKNS